MNFRLCDFVEHASTLHTADTVEFDTFDVVVGDVVASVYWALAVTSVVR